ncbi:hypothetical protein GYMLUDRAFT_134567, partial [Collybiopsis luxurians FD-317 M1]
NWRTSQWKYGHSRRGVRCVTRRHFVQGEWVSILPALTLNGIITYDIIHDSVTFNKSIQFLKEHLISLTNPYPGP